MADQGNWIPLFPLQLALFPESKVPLHAFEERYKKLIAECPETGDEFVVKFADGHLLESVGCTAAVSEVINRTKDVYLMGRIEYIVQNNGYIPE
jgi:Lon protease-like protein